MPTVDELLKQMDEAETEAGSLGGAGNSALFAKITTAWGYKVFARGSAHEESFFPTPFPPKGDVAKATLELAKAYQKANGCDASPAYSWVMSIGITDVIGKAVTWKAGQHKVAVRWKKKDADGVTKSLLDDFYLPELIKLDMVAPGTYFIRIRYFRNPLDPGTDESPNILWMPAEVFKNEASCRSAADKFYLEQGDKEAGTAAAGNLPEGWDAATWAKLSPKINAALKGGGAPATVAGEWGIPVSWMITYAASLA